MSPAAARTFDVRHVQLARAAFAALAAAMITFSPDHSASVGLSVFSGFAIATGIVLALSAWLVYSQGARWPAVLLAVIALMAGMASGISPWRTTTLFFVLVIAWAALSGVVETIAGWRARRSGGPARDALTVGILTIVLAIALLFVRPDFALEYYIADAGQSFTLTGITIGVGLFGGYAAIVAVFLAIAGFSPRAAERPVAPDTASGDPA